MGAQREIVVSEWDERHPREPDPGEGVRIIGPQRDPRDPRDPRASQDDPRRWGNFAETQPRWSDDQGYEPPAEPPPGRSVFGDDPAPPVETYEDAYRDQNYDDRGAPDRPAADEYYGDQGYGDHPRQPPPPPPSPRGQGFDQS